MAIENKIIPLKTSNVIDGTCLDYENHTYQQLLQELGNYYWRAINLIPIMYNRLTLKEGLSHKEAVNKMRGDLKDLQGFSKRNIYRYLPSGNPNTPHRVVPARHKVSNTAHSSKQKLSDTELNPETNLSDASKLKLECPNCLEYERQLDEHKEALLKATRPIAADNLKDYRGIVHKEKERIVSKAFQKSKQLTYLIFDSENILFDARPDSY